MNRDNSIINTIDGIAHLSKEELRDETLSAFTNDPDHYRKLRVPPMYMYIGIHVDIHPTPRKLHHGNNPNRCAFIPSNHHASQTSKCEPSPFSLSVDWLKATIVLERKHTGACREQYCSPRFTKVWNLFTKTSTCKQKQLTEISCLVNSFKS